LRSASSPPPPILPDTLNKKPAHPGKGAGFFDAIRHSLEDAAYLFSCNNPTVGLLNNYTMLIYVWRCFMGLIEEWNKVCTSGTTLTLSCPLFDIPTGTTLMVTGSSIAGLFSNEICTLIETTHGTFRFAELMACAEVIA
jgi:hypothetical protein